MGDVFEDFFKRHKMLFKIFSGLIIVTFTVVVAAFDRFATKVELNEKADAMEKSNQDSMELLREDLHDIKRSVDSLGRRIDHYYDGGHR